jgi:hypothetical protein
VQRRRPAQAAVPPAPASSGWGKRKGRCGELEQMLGEAKGGLVWLATGLKLELAAASGQASVRAASRSPLRRGKPAAPSHHCGAGQRL